MNKGHLGGWRSVFAGAALVLLAGLLLTGLAVHWQWGRLVAEAEADFQVGARRIADHVGARLHQPLQALHGARGLISAAPAVGREGFRSFVAARELQAEFPGMRGLGLILPVKKTEVADFVRRQRADDAPGFDIRQLQDKDLDALFVITYIEPLAANAAALGLDIASEKRRRDAAQRAVDSGRPTMTSPITILQDPLQRPAVLVFSPVYAHGAVAPAPALRRSQIKGLVYSPIVMGELLEGLQQSVADGLHFELTDLGSGGSPEVLVYDASRPLAPLGSQASGSREGLASRFSTVFRLDVHGRALALHVHSTPAFEAAVLRSSTPWVLGAGGVTVSLLLAALMAQQARARWRAEALAERATGESQRLAQVARHTSNAVAITDAALTVTWVNEGYTRITGLAPEEACGQPLASLLRHAGAPDAPGYEAWHTALRQGTGCRVELLKQHRHGYRYWADTELQPLRDSQRRLVGFMEIASDVTDRREAQDRLQTALAANDQLLSTLDQYALVAVTDPAGRISSINDAFCRASGYTREEMLGADRRLFDSGHHPREFWVDMARRVRCGALWRGEILYRFKDGSLHWFDNIVAPFRGRDGSIDTYITIGHEITALKVAEQQVRRAEALLRGAIDTVNEGFVIYDPQDRLVLCNDKYREIYATSADLLVPGNSFEHIIRTGAQRGQYAEAIGRVEAWVEERMAAHLASNRTLVQRLGDGRWLRIIERKTPEGYIVGFRIDITDLMQARDAAEAASRSKGQFLANMSHEIRTPMNAILGMLQLLRRTGLDTQQRDYTDKTERAARAMLALLNDILDFSKLDADKMQLDPRPFPLDRLLRDLSVIVAANLGGKPVEVVFDIDPALPHSLVGDDLRLQQVLVNLSGNAIKFTEAGEVVVRLSLRGEDDRGVRLGVSVTDTGIGIAPEHQAQIFDGFSQAEASTTRRFGGTGLGLAISQRLVALMGGRLQLDSQLGQGSCFSFELCLPRAAQGDLPAQPSTEPRPAESLRVLLVDDHPSALAAQQRMAQSLGWQVAVAADLDSALHQARQLVVQGGAIDAVFVDDGWVERVGSGKLRELLASTGRPQPAGRGTGSPGHELQPRPARLIRLSARPELHPLVNEHADAIAFDALVTKPVTASLLKEAWQQAQTGIGRQAETRAQPAQPNSRLYGLRVLLVEDNAINQQVASELLEAEGAQVWMAGDGLQALNFLRSRAGSVDVVLMDLQMPVMDGLSATRAIRAELGLHSLPIVAMTANALAGDREVALAAGMNEHVGKPFDLTALVQVLKAQTRHQAPDGLAEARSDTDTAPAASPASSAPPDLQAVLRQLEQPVTVPPRLVAAAAQADVAIGPALSRMHGRIDIYHRMLHRITNSLPSTAEELQQLAQRGDVEGVTRSLHTLKGSTAMLGADDLSAVMAELERQASSVDGLLTAVGAACERLVREVPRWEQFLEAVAEADRPEPGAAMPQRAAALFAALDRLSAMLREDDPEVPTLMSQLRREHGRDLGAKLVPLDDAVATRDRARAMDMCRALREQVGAVSG